MVLINPLANGTDQESPDDARKRPTTRLQKKLHRKGGAPQDYSEWGIASRMPMASPVPICAITATAAVSANVGGGGGYDGLAGIMGVQHAQGFRPGAHAKAQHF